MPRLNTKVTGDRARFTYSLSDEESTVLPFTGQGGWRSGIGAQGAPGDAVKFAGMSNRGSAGGAFGDGAHMAHV